MMVNREEVVSEAKRVVLVRVERFVGHGAHVHVSMRELPEGVERYMKFVDPRRAIQWVEDCFVREFSPETHELNYAPGATRRWFYRDGD